MLAKHRDPTYGKWTPSPQGVVDADLWTMFRTCDPDFSPATGGSDGCDKEEEERIRGRKVASLEWMVSHRENGILRLSFNIEVRSKVE